LVIDVSGSMEIESRLELVKDSLVLLIDQLRPTDKIAIIAYSDTAWVVLPSTYVEDKEMIKEEINKLRPMDSTNAEAGLKLGYEEALKGFMPGAINRVILCSDGVANVGNTGAGSIWETIKYQASEGITLTSVGFGMGNYNDVLLEQLADNGDGFYAYVDTIDEAERLFVYDLVSTLQVIALDAKVQVDFNPEVVSRYRLVGFENRAIADEDFRDDSVDAAEIGAGHSITALYEVKLFPEANGEIFTVYLRWEDPDDHLVHETEEAFFTHELGESFSSADPYFQLDVIVAEFAEILRDSYWAEGSTLENLLEYAENIGGLVEHQKVFELIELIELAISFSE
jgi:Ca-activated chloride channel family protein